MADFRTLTVLIHRATSSKGKNRPATEETQIEVGLVSRIFILIILMSTCLALHANVVRYQFDIPAGKAGVTLNILAQQSKTPLLFPYDEVGHITTNTVIGDFTLNEAVSLLLMNTGLEGEVDEKGVLIITNGISNTLSIEGTDKVNKTKNKSWISTILTGLVGAATVASVSAQDSIENGNRESVIEEVVVTAQKRQENIQDVPISIKAFSGENLDEFGILSSQDIMTYVPNASVASNGGSKFNYFIRGVGTYDFHSNHVSSIGIFTDNVALNSPFQLAFSTLDIERVEVLRGPQNTLFGRNTTGGAVSFVSRKPSVEDGTNGFIKAGYGRYDQIDVEAAGGIALSDNLAARFAVSSNTRDGVFHNVTRDEKEGETDRQALRGQILWQASDSLEFLVNVRGGQSNATPHPYKGTGILDPNDLTQPCSVPGGVIRVIDNPNCVNAAGENLQTDDWEDVTGGTKTREEIDTWGLTLTSEWDVGPFTLVSTTSYDSFKMKFNSDDDSGPTVMFQFNQQGEYDQWAQELRLQSHDDQRLRWIAGLYYFNEEARYTTVVRRTPAANIGAAGAGNFNITPNTIVDQDNEVISGFGQLEFDIQDNLTATMGLRYTHETKKGYNRVSVRCVGTTGPPFCPPLDESTFIGFDNVETLPLLFPGSVDRLNGTYKDWGMRAALDWQVNDDVLLYASISRGFKSGGFNLAALQGLLGLAAQDVDNEVLWAYEIGAKTTWMDGRLQLNAAAFYYDWSELQTFATLFVNGIPTPQLLNVPESSMYGADLEIQWVPAEDWLVSAGLGFLDSQIDDPGAIVELANAKGNELINAPSLTFNGLISKDIQLASGVLNLQTTVRYKDDHTSTLTNEPFEYQDGYWLLNARASYRFGNDEQYDISVWGKNLTSEKYCIAPQFTFAGFSDTNNCLPNLSEPTFGVAASMEF